MSVNATTSTSTTTPSAPVAMAMSATAEAVIATRMDGEYRPSFVAGILHSLPHLNIRLHLINSTFAPENKLYLESLGILAFIPAACLIFTLLVLLLYFLTRCCDRKPKPKRSITGCKWFSITVFVLFIWGAVALSLYGNHEMHEKISDVLKGLKGMDDSVTELEIKMERFEESRKSASMRLDQLKFHSEPPPAQQSRNEELAHEIQQLSKYVHGDQPVSRFAQIRSSLRIFKKAWLYKAAENVEFYRWIGTMVLWGLMVVLCLMLMIGLCSYSRCTLITFSVCGLLMVIASWLQASLYLFASVAIGDYCMQPDMYLRTLVRVEDQRILDYYMHCGTNPNPWAVEMNATKEEVSNAMASFQRASQMVSTMYRDKNILMDALGKYMLELNQTLPELASHLDCRTMHRHYLASTRICDKGLCGLCFMLIASVLSGLFFTILFWVDSHIWIYLDNRRDYTQVDGQDRYLPPSAASQAIAARTLRGQGSYSTSGLFRQKNLHDGSPHAVTQHLLDGKGLREEKPQHGGIHPGGSDTLPGPNHGQYATLSKQCKTLESNDFYN